VLPVTDSTIVAGQVDAVILVYQAGKVGRLVLKRAKVHLEGARARVLGVVLNDVQTEVAGYQYAHYYTHYYGEESGMPAETSAVARAWQRVRGVVDRVRGRASDSARRMHDDDGPYDDGGEPPDAAPPAPPRPRRGYRNTTLGLLILAGLVATIGGALVWRAARNAPPSTPREALRERLNAPPAPAIPPPAPAPAKPAVAVPAAGGASPAPGPSAATPATVPPPPAAAPPASDAAAPAVATTAAVVATPREPAPAATPVANATAPPAPRFAIEIGPFTSASEADQVERQLEQHGFPAARVRQPGRVSLYAVVIEKVGTPREADALVRRLREQGFEDTVLLGDDGPLSVRVGQPLPLRGAVAVGEKLRALGHPVRVASQPGEVATFVVRHGAYASREQAGEKGEALKRLGLTTQIVQVR
jgi:cell division protein FtsN